MPMPDKQMVGGKLYRYAFQGQEKDHETGKEAFQLRLWDGRIGRWLSPDPAGEFFSPYLGMGNNPISVIDPDGGCTTCPDDAKLGDTFSHSDYGKLTFTDTGWASPDFGNILDDVMISGQGSGLSGIAGVRFEQWKQTIEPDFIHRRSESAKYMAEHPAFQIMMMIATSGGASASLMNAGSKGFTRYAWRTTANQLKMANSRFAGQLGEKLVGARGGKFGRIESLTETAAYRVPDKVINGNIHEVKNVKYLRFTPQLRDFQLYTLNKGKMLTIHTRSNTILSKELQSLVNDGKILQEFIKGL